MKQSVMIGRKWLGISTIYFCMFMHTVVAQDISVRTFLDRDTILIGDQILFSIEVTQPRNLDVFFPVFADTLVDKIEILEQSSIDTIKATNDLTHVTQSLLITCFDSGTHRIPELKFTYITKSQEQEIFSQSSQLQVLTMPLDTAQAIFDIKMPYQAPLTFSELLPYFLGGILAIAVILIAVWYFRQRRRKKVGYVPFKPSEPPHIIALRKLDKLKEKRLWQSKKIKLYYTNLTEILRIYLEGRYQIYAMEHTSEEILWFLKNTGFNDNNLYLKLKEILQLSDLVKFAKVKPLPEENETSLLDAYSFINETKPVEPAKLSEKPVEADDNNDSNPEKMQNKELSDNISSQ